MPLASRSGRTNQAPAGMSTVPARIILAAAGEAAPKSRNAPRRWHTASAAFVDKGWVLHHLLRQASKSDRYDLKTCAALFMAGYAHRFSMAVAGQFVGRQVMPDLSPENVRLRERTRIVFHPWRLSRVRQLDVEIPGGGMALSQDSPGQLREQLEAHFAPLIFALHRHSGLSAQSLWRLAGDAIAAAFLESGRRAKREEQAMADALAILKHPGSPFANRQMHYFKISVSDPDRPSRVVTRSFRQRGGCCRYYTAFPGKFCSTCVLKDPAERDRALEARILRRLTLHHLPKRLYQHAKARLGRHFHHGPRNSGGRLRGPSSGG